MRQSVEAPVVDTVEQMLVTAQIAEQRREQAKQAILNEQLSGVQLGVVAGYYVYHQPVIFANNCASSV